MGIIITFVDEINSIDVHVIVAIDFVNDRKVTRILKKISGTS